jgi:hypothetical protein
MKTVTGTVLQILKKLNANLILLMQAQDAPRDYLG